MLTEALKHSPFCAFLSLGDPSPFAAEIREAGTLLIYTKRSSFQTSTLH